MGETARRLTAGAAIATALIAFGCGFGGQERRSAGRPVAEAGPPSPTPSPPTAELAAAPDPVPPHPPPTAPRVKPSKRPVQVGQAPPPPKRRPPGTAPSCPPRFTGTAASRAEVRAALDAAAGHVFWPKSAPQIKVPANLLYAVAWQESGWQSNILACDGGIGTMQVMPDTAGYINQRFATAYDVHTLSGNTMLGAGWLAWTIKFLGDNYFADSYDLADQGLLEAVIAAYNVGVGAVHPDAANPADRFPNPKYVSSVKNLMSSCPCLA